MNYNVGNQQQALSSTNNSTTGQILNSAQAQSGETFYSTTPPQDLNQPPSSVDAIAATLCKFLYISILKNRYQEQSVIF